MNDTPEFRVTPSTVPKTPHTPSCSSEDSPKDDFDPRIYRPLDVCVSITMHDIQGHLVKVNLQS